MTKKIRVGVLFGGKSAEHEVSLLSAKNVIQAINREKYEVVLLGIDKQGGWHLHEDSNYLLNETNPKLIKFNTAVDDVAIVPGENTKNTLRPISKGGVIGSVDVVFPVLHGTNGEDGTVQGLLKLLGIPFVGPSILGSAVGMDKDVTKRLLRDAGIPIGDFVAINREQRGDFPFASLVKRLGLPFFVKPANAGSSVGVSKVKDEDQFNESMDHAFQFDRKILVEEFIRGREIECAVLGNEDPKASVLGEIIPTHEFYSYDAKYIDENGAGQEIPANLPKNVSDKIRALAIQTFKVLCCEGLARVDFFVRENGDALVNEINTIPGFTKISMYPKLWEATGVSYGSLIEQLIELALKRHEIEQGLKTTND